MITIAVHLKYLWSIQELLQTILIRMNSKDSNSIFAKFRSNGLYRAKRFMTMVNSTSLKRKTFLPDFDKLYIIRVSFRNLRLVRKKNNVSCKSFMLVLKHNMYDVSWFCPLCISSTSFRLDVPTLTLNVKYLGIL